MKITGWVIAMLIAVFVLITSFPQRGDAETAREKFKARLTAQYEKLEKLAKADGCTDTKRYWTYSPDRHGVVLLVECVATRQTYWLSAPDAHQKVRNAQ